MKEIPLKTPSGRSMLFTDGTGGHEENLIVICWGVDHSGKSRLGATGPEVVGYVPLDRKTRYTAEKTSREQGCKILMPVNDFVTDSIKGVRSMQAGNKEYLDSEVKKLTEQTKAQYRAHVDAIKECTYALYDSPDVKLIEIDLFTQFYEYMKYAYYGRTGHTVKKIGTGPPRVSTSEADQEIIDFVNSLSKKHLILTHKSTPEYEHNQPTGVEVWKGFKHLGHHCNLQVEMVLNKQYKLDSEKDSESWHYGLNLIRSVHSPELEGEAGQLILRDDMISFSNLRDLVLG